MGLSDIFVDFSAPETDSRQVGVARAEVISVLDSLMLGRVQVSIPSLPDIEPWAPVCAPFAGEGYGLWCMPQVGDTVIVAFEHGDPALPIVIGSIWSSSGDAPIDQPLDAQYKRVLKTPGGHTLVFDDLLKKITLSHAAEHTVELAMDGITISLAGGAASLTLSAKGSAALAGKTSAEVKAPKTAVKGDLTLDVEGATTTVKADGTLRISGGLVTIN
ncbi:phage baseplate assembly protein V [Microbacterium terricola]|uniref:Phage tail protein n=1 Tax=Microbacterium terricola TaxID=344163 RepID=A0ABM8E191_9MICO|nr:phage baseplate assembly protein V [Microbacterium terricola]UYK40717.1 phage baseplate assembly protein V [Microbacterium terricola]BDV31546.1 phage tail protein [Microbacterium terricola]